MAAVLNDGMEDNLALPSLARRVQDMGRGVGNWTRVAEAVRDEFVALHRGLGFAALERLDGQDAFEVLVTRDIDFLQPGRRERAASLPILVEAAAEPGRVLSTEAFGSEGALACAALPAGVGAQYFFLLVGHTPALGAARLGQLAGQLLDLVAPAAGPAVGKARKDAVSIAIGRAKREWEQAADALPSIVGIADDAGHLLRVNRALTAATGIPVSEALGRPLHAVLHGGCTDPDCAFEMRLAVGLRLLPAHRKLSMNIRDEESNVDWAIHLRHKAGEGSQPGQVVFSATDVSQVERAMRKLAAENQHLEAQVAERTRELESSNKALASSRGQLEQLLERHQTQIEDERRQIAEHLHHSIGQSLVAVKYSLENAIEAATRGTQPSADALNRAVDLVQHMVQDVREVAGRLRPADLDELGLAAAMRSLCSDWAAGLNGLDVGVDFAIDDSDVPERLWLPIFRIAQEALNNVARHACAENVGITLGHDGDEIVLSIEDDGIGFDPAELPDGASLGLVMLRERAEGSGGRFRLDTAADRGTTVEARWPLSANADTEED